VPSGSSLSPRRIPLGLIGLRGFPKSEILLIPFLPFLIGLLLLSFSLFDSFQLSVFEFFLKSLDIEVNRSIGSISISVGDNSFDKGHNLRDVLCNPGNIVWNANSKLTL
jgi:hypothetical protein